MDPIRARRFLVIAAFAAALAVASGAVVAADRSTYGEDRAFLSRHANIAELTNEHGARVLVCPDYQGRVMTSTCDGLEGPSFGWINRSFIEAGKNDLHFNNYGGEDRFWLAPEGGQFALFFAPGAEPTLANWLTPPGFNEGAFKLQSSGTPGYRLTRTMQLRNASDTQFDIGVVRDVRMLGQRTLAERFGAATADAMDTAGVKSVAYESINRITNRAADWSQQRGLLSLWILGQFPPGDETVIIVPYKPGDEATLGPVVNSDYFGQVPAERLRVTPQAILFHGDGKHRSKIGASQRRARPVAGSYDFANDVLTLVHFTMPKDPAAELYVNNSWKLPQEAPYVGDVFNSYNDGPPEPGAATLGGFYELETLSPARPLRRGESLEHTHTTVHVVGPPAALKAAAQAALGVDLDEVRREMFGAPK